MFTDIQPDVRFERFKSRLETDVLYIHLELQRKMKIQMNGYIFYFLSHLEVEWNMISTKVTHLKATHSPFHFHP